MSCPATPRPLPFTVERVPEKELSQLQSWGFRGYEDLVRTNPSRVNLRHAYSHLAEAYYNFEFRPDDVVLATYPRSGTTWTSEILWAMKNLGRLDKADEVTNSDRTIFIDMDFLMPSRADDDNPKIKEFLKVFPEGRVEDGVTLQMAKSHKGSRIIKTHLQIDLLNPDLLDTCKVVYVARNPKDVCVSLFHHARISKMDSFEGDFPEYAEAFMANQVIYGPYWDHVDQAWRRRNHANLHFMFYEDMKRDIISELRRLAAFLQLDFTDEQLKIISDHASFGRMKSRHERETAGHNHTPGFFRKGQTGDWNNVASKELNALMDKWISENSQCTDIDFKYV
ncbi:sulfotransferase family cytosolic 1B member 1-like [Penaeus japonicus]|uniref:sulfotransferase family cytosolic 1B member 1-like n=1 Tax=Penaeus japonicus TaxID=27405 RepID=UPI001C70D98A|nr:sulfotransferase family cytosolic 1B member 1-like [Penaeus japonicus]XP_042858265.1 sulfotransferase family cytosolic 1B member 1-like [Penaeus japonicus]XP_042858267.1 sulfotransferase family cytosolic 1B member 1-like [Penaeus japonicus]